MLKIDARTMRLLETAQHRAFGHFLCSHVRRFFPSAYEHYSDAQLELHIQTLVADALRRGLRTERGLCLYINVASALGRRFETDSTIYWPESIAPGDGENLDPHWIARVANSAIGARRRTQQ